MITDETVNQMKVLHDKAVCLKTKADIEAALDSMAQEITAQLSDTHPVLLCVMIGGLIPTGHLATRLSFPLQIDYLHVSRYGNSQRGGDLHWFVEPRQSLAGRTVIVVEDILDGGLTLAAIVDYCQKAGAKAVYTAVVVEKERTREPGALEKADFVGMRLPDYFLYGFGLDCEGYMRNHAAIYRVPEEA